MSIEFEIKKPEDQTRINSNEATELLWWSYHLRMPPEKLLSAVHEVGNSLEKVMKHIWPSANQGHTG